MKQNLNIWIYRGEFDNGTLHAAIFITNTSNDAIVLKCLEKNGDDVELVQFLFNVGVQMQINKRNFYFWSTEVAYKVIRFNVALIMLSDARI